MAQKTSIKNPPHPYEDKATRRERARFEKMKADADKDYQKRMSQPLPTEVMTRPGSRRKTDVLRFTESPPRIMPRITRNRPGNSKPLPPMAKRQREKKYSFGALEKDKDLSLAQYREKAGRDPMGYKERKTKEVFAGLDTASAAGIPHLASLGAKALAGLAGGRLVAGRAATEAGKEAGKKFMRQGGEKLAEKGAKDSARPGKKTDIVQRPAPRPLAQASPFPLGSSDKLRGSLMGPGKKRDSQEEWSAKRARARRLADRQKKAKSFSTKPSV